MSKTVGEYLSENINDFKRLSKHGVVSLNLITNHTIYTYYKGINPKSMPSKMDRYQFTADSMKTYLNKVREAVSQMEKPMR